MCGFLKVSTLDTHTQWMEKKPTYKQLHVCRGHLNKEDAHQKTHQHKARQSEDQKSLQRMTYDVRGHRDQQN